MKTKFYFFRMLTLLVLAGLTFGKAVTPVGAAGANDDFDTSTEITSLPFSVVEDTTAATAAMDDPAFPCGSLDAGSNTVWYSFTPTENGTLYVNTHNSDYDTMLAVWTGERGSLTNVACNDDYVGETSALRVALTAGVAYYIEAADKNGTGGNLDLYVNFGGTCADGLNDENNLPLFTTRDNQDESNSGNGDCDMDDYLFKTDENTPIEFTINVPYADGLTSVDLFLLAKDVDIGEIDNVYFNGNLAGVLTGANEEWSTTILSIDPAWVVQGDNLVKIEITDTGWAVNVDWGQLVLNGQPNGDATIRSLTTDQPSYVAGNTINVTIEVDGPLPTQQLRTEINLRNETGAIIAGDTIDHTITSTDEGPVDDPVVASLAIPANLASGVYEIQAIVYDRLPNLFQDSASTSVTIYKKQTLTVRSAGAYDGHILETSEKSNKGGVISPSGSMFYLGDDASNRQYKAILSFNTSALPDNAVIDKVTLKIRKAGLTGMNPFLKLGWLKADIRRPYFGANVKLAASDFQVAANKPAIGTFGKTPVNNWYSAVLGKTAHPFINLKGTTQFRLRFTLDDNNNRRADYMKFFSGNYKTASMRPMLIIEYHVP